MAKNFFKFSLGAAAIIALGLGLFYVASYYQEWRDRESIAQQQKPDEIIITELPNGEKLVENKTEGVSVKIPAEWTIDGTKDQFYPPQSFKENEIICKIESYVSNEVINDIEKFKNEHSSSDELTTVIKSEYTDLIIYGYPALLSFIETDINVITREAIIFTPNKTYNFAVYDLSTNRDKCYKKVEFDKFLQTVSLK